MRILAAQLGMVFFAMISPVAFADPPATVPSVVVPPLSGKLGTPIQLFDGKSLEGWVWFQKPPKKGSTATPVTIDDVFSVHDGVLHSKGKPTGYIRTEREFTNYVLTVEERHLVKGNGGLLVGIRGADHVWPGIEIQTMTGDAGDLWNHNHLKLTADPARINKTRIIKIGPDSQKPVGEWDTMEVTVDRGNLVYKVNGVVQNVATDTESLAGKVGIQVEGAEMEFRKVQMTPIEDAGADPIPATQPVNAAAISAPPISAPIGEPVELFNGKDLDGWKWVQRPPKSGSADKPVTIDAVWTVRDGVLHDAGKPIGYIHTEKSYDNYVLLVEQRHVSKGNGGVLFAISGPDKVWPHCLECQGQVGEEGDLRNVGEFKMTIDPARTESPRRLKRIGPDPEKPIGEWETVKIVVDHGNLSVFIDDTLQNLATQTEDLNGMIGLQAEGGEMEFRKIELRPILAP